jgi:hypothetical protein
LLAAAAASAVVLLAACDQGHTQGSEGAGPRDGAAAGGSAGMDATLGGEPWTAASIHYHVDQSFNAKEYAHTLEARAADGSKLDMIILSAELTLSPRSYPGTPDEEVSITFTPAGRSARTFSGDSGADARVEILSERTSNSVAGSFTATLQDLNPSGQPLKLDGSFRNIPRAKP